MDLKNKTSKQLVANLIGMKEEDLPNFNSYRELLEEISHIEISEEQKEKIEIFIELYYRDLPIKETVPLNCSRDIYFLTRRSMEDLTQEEMKIICLNAKKEVVSIKTVSKGSSTEGVVTPKEIFREAILKAAHSIAIVHNHPDGDSRMSEADLLFTQQLISASKTMEIQLIDHVIIGKNQWTSILGKKKFTIIEDRITVEILDLQK